MSGVGASSTLSEGDGTEAVVCEVGREEAEDEDEDLATCGFMSVGGEEDEAAAEKLESIVAETSDLAGSRTPSEFSGLLILDFCDSVSLNYHKNDFGWERAQLLKIDMIGLSVFLLQVDWRSLPYLFLGLGIGARFFDAVTWFERL